MTWINDYEGVLKEEELFIVEFHFSRVTSERF